MSEEGEAPRQSQHLPDPLQAVALERHYGPLRRLLRLLTRPNKFQLILLQYNDHAYRETLAQALQVAAPAGIIWTLDGKIRGHFAAFESELAQQAARAQIVQVIGLEAWRAGDEADDLFKGLNYHREAIAELGCTLLLWLPAFDITAFALKAPDMWAWRTVVLDFSTDGAPTAHLERVDEEWVHPVQVDEILHYLETATQPAPGLVLKAIRGLLANGETTQARALMAQWQDWLLHETQTHDVRLDAMRVQADISRAERAFDEALEILDQAQTLCEKVGDRVGLVKCYGALADILADTGQLDPAMAMLGKQQALADELGDRLLIAQNFGAQARILAHQTRTEEAVQLYRKALVIDEATLGSDHHRVAIDLNNLAFILLNSQRQEEAEPLLRRALAIKEAAFGPNHPAMTASLRNLATPLFRQRRLTEAEQLYRRALAIDEAAFGPDHPQVARDLNNLANLFSSSKRLAEAEPLYRQVLAIDEAAFGPNHLQVACDLNNLAKLLSSSQRLAEAEYLFRRAAGICQAVPGPDHPSTQMFQRNLQKALTELGQENT